MPGFSATLDRALHLNSVYDPKVNRPEATVSSITTDLLSRAQASDQAAWDYLVDLYGPLAYQWCRQHGLGPQHASEVAREVFESASGNLSSFRQAPGVTFLEWLRTITDGKLREFWSYRKPDVLVDRDAQKAEGISAALGGSSESDDEVRVLFMRILEFARNRFDPAHWHIFWRVFVQQQNPAEVAVNLGIERHKVYVIKSRVLKTLREVFDDEFNAENQRDDGGRYE